MGRNFVILYVVNCWKTKFPIYIEAPKQPHLKVENVSRTGNT